jgi:hypothetical protein
LLGRGQDVQQDLEAQAGKAASLVSQNMATLITKKVRWYQETTERMRVSITCSIRVAAVTRKTPA